MDAAEYQKVTYNMTRRTLAREEVFNRCGLKLLMDVGCLVAPIDRHLHSGEVLEREYILYNLGEIAWSCSEICTQLGHSFAEVSPQLDGAQLFQAIGGDVLRAINAQVYSLAEHIGMLYRYLHEYIFGDKPLIYNGVLSAIKWVCSASAIIAFALGSSFAEVLERSASKVKPQKRE